MSVKNIIFSNNADLWCSGYNKVAELLLVKKNLRKTCSEDLKII